MVVVTLGQLSSLHFTCVPTQRQIEHPFGPSLNSSRSRYQFVLYRQEKGAVDCLLNKISTLWIVFECLYQLSTLVLVSVFLELHRRVV